MSINWSKVRFLGIPDPEDHLRSEWPELRPFDRLVARARMLAERAHHGQKYGDRPYTWHLRMVVSLVQDPLFCPVIQRVITMAAWLHDVLEDTSVESVDLDPWGYLGIPELVHAVTGRGATREDRVRAYLSQIADAGPVAVYLKVCDRLANVSAAMADQNEEKFTMYLGEYPEFCRRLRSETFESEPHARALDVRWRMLDGLSGTLALHQVKDAGEA